MTIQTIFCQKTLQSISGGATTTEVIKCAIDATKAYLSGSPVDIASAALSCAPVVKDATSQIVNDIQMTYYSSNWNTKPGQGDISPEGVVIVATWVPKGEYYDDGSSCIFQ